VEPLLAEMERCIAVASYHKVRVGRYSSTPLAAEGLPLLDGGSSTTYHNSRVGQNRICTPYMTVCMVISLLKIPYIYRIYVCMYGLGQPYITVVGKGLLVGRWSFALYTCVYTYTVFDRTLNEIPAENTISTPYIHHIIHHIFYVVHIYVWFCPTLRVCVYVCLHFRCN
jgi:hypothetical protein